MKRKSKITPVLMSSTQLKKLDRICRRRRLNRSQLIRLLVAEEWARSSRRQPVKTSMKKWMYGDLTATELCKTTDGRTVIETQYGSVYPLDHQGRDQNGDTWMLCPGGGN